ncbi:MAG: hypothetical protein RLZZ232_352 [Planctomycetota bacterium]|jgi:hypothetical protein
MQPFSEFRGGMGRARGQQPIPESSNPETPRLLSTGRLSIFHSWSARWNAGIAGLPCIGGWWIAGVLRVNCGSRVNDVSGGAIGSEVTPAFRLSGMMCPCGGWC